MGKTAALLSVVLLAALAGCGGDSGRVDGSGGSSGSGGVSGGGSGGSSASGGASGSGGSAPVDAAEGTGGSASGGTSGGSGGDNGGTGGDNGGTGGAAPDAGGGTDAPVTGSSGLPRTTTIADLSDTQRPTLCDWWNAKQGGYGQSADCGGEEPEVTDGDQAECVDGLDACATATVADFEDCGNAIGTDLCKFRTDAACATLAACF